MLDLGFKINVICKEVILENGLVIKSFSLNMYKAKFIAINSTAKSFLGTIVIIFIIKVVLLKLPF